jgi:endonuclease/exonuclease/phosphatase family metal-dependent hydrolase
MPGYTAEVSVGSLPSLLAHVVGLLALGCASAHNYVEPDRPLYEASFGVAPMPRGEIRVVTYNIAYGRNVPAAIEVLRSQPSLRDLDVLLLQEMDAPGVEAIATSLSLNSVYYPSSLSPKTNRDLGTAILSPWPIEDRWKIQLPHLSRFSGHARAAVGVRMRIGDQHLRVYSLHLGTPINLSPQDRRDQLEAVLEDAAKAASGDAVIIGGDFNGKQMAERVASRGLTWPTRDIGRTTAYFSFDHVLARGLAPGPGVSAGVVREAKGVSDHLPVWASFASR